MTSLERRFHEAMLNIYKLGLEHCNYRAKAFLSMVVEKTGVVAAKQLLATDVIQSGLYELWDCGRLDLTVETLVLQDEYQSLFEHHELDEARRRLSELEVGPTG